VHPDEYELLQYLENTVEQHKRKQIEDHSARCEQCAHLLADLSRLPQVLDHPVPFEPDPAVLMKAMQLAKRKGPRRWFGMNTIAPPFRIAIAGTTLFVIALTAYLVLPREEPDRFRSGTEDEVPAFGLFPADGAIVRDYPPDFHWKEIHESAAYRFSLLDGSGAVLWTADIRDTSILLPSSVVLQPGFTYLWRVESSFADNTLRSALHAFTYSPPP
jgi:hypothetical protein